MSTKRRVDNPDLIPYALYLLGGTGEFVDVEDVYVKCHELAPERFSWRSKPLPNYKSLSKALRDFEGKRATLLLKTPDGLRRQLSAEGVEWLKANQADIEAAIGVPGGNPPTRRPGQRLLNELADQQAVREFGEGGRPELKKFQVADLLVCSPDSPPSVFRERLETYRSAAEEGGRPDLLAFLDFLKSEMSQLFEG